MTTNNTVSRTPSGGYFALSVPATRFTLRGDLYLLSLAVGAFGVLAVALVAVCS